MATEIRMPQLSDTMNEGTILTWHKKVGDTVTRGEALAEVATDKADLEIESFHEGTLLKIHSPEGTTVKVGSVIAVIGQAGEEVGASDAPPAEAAAPVATPADPQPAQHHAQAPQQFQTPQAMQAAPQVANGHPSTNGDNRVKISPLAKNLATSFGVDYNAVQGSGDGGRIVKRDIEAQIGQPVNAQQIEQAVQKQPQAASQPQPVQQSRAPQPAAPTLPTPKQAPAPQQAPAVGQGVQPLSRMRQTIAARMVESVSTAPHFYVTGKINADAFMKLRGTLKSLPQYDGITFNHLVIKAAALALKAVPRINAFFDNNSLVQPGSVNIGIITALEDGLLIPVVKNADALPLADVVQEANGLVQRARAGRPKADDLVGGTFSISNIGKADVDNFSAIINPGQGAILAVSSIQQEPVVDGAAIRVGNVMRITLSVDHRIIDGVVAGQFVTELKRILEEPVLLLA